MLRHDLVQPIFQIAAYVTSLIVSPIINCALYLFLYQEHGPLDLTMLPTFKITLAISVSLKWNYN